MTFRIFAGIDLILIGLFVILGAGKKLPEPAQKIFLAVNPIKLHWWYLIGSILILDGILRLFGIM